MKHFLRKALILTVSLSMVIALALSFIFLFTHTGHTCDNQDACPVCACISVCKGFADAAGAEKTNAFAAVSFGLILLIAFAVAFVKKISLINLKIRLNN